MNGGIVLKRRLFYALILILALSAGARAAADAGDGPLSVPVSDYIRLHVLAEDDTDDAQALKLQVRDACLARARELLADCADADDAWQAVNDNLAALEEAAAARARELGWDGPVTAETGVFDFPDRRYGGVFVPAGEYRALRVVIGAGEGHNWWCVLYPTLCYPQDVLADAPVRFHSTVLNWLKAIFGGEA